MSWESIVFYIVLFCVIIILGFLYDRYDTKKMKKERSTRYLHYHGGSSSFGAGGGDNGGCGGDGC